mmetsp:Transcript_25516/g.63886  ORF Transcript_25516/g.63886 Transcript_25516/m.63886 type:complete len:294 (-) Transcript_25516:4497-5378(-)
MFAGESALASGYYVQHVEEVCNTIVRVVSKFDKLLEASKVKGDPQFAGVSLTISEGFFLVWTDPTTGDAPGRLSSGEDHTFLIGAFFMDLLSHGYIHLDKDEENGAISANSKVVLTKKASEENHKDGHGIGNHLDYLLERIRMSRPKTLKRWITKLYGERTYFKAVVDELVKKGVVKAVKKNSLFFTRKWSPAANEAVEKALRDSLKSLLLQHHEKAELSGVHGLADGEDPRLVALLCISRLADCYDLNEHFLPHIFTKEELEHEHTVQKLKELVDDTINHTKVQESAQISKN